MENARLSPNAFIMLSFKQCHTSEERSKTSVSNANNMWTLKQTNIRCKRYANRLKSSLGGKI